MPAAEARGCLSYGLAPRANLGEGMDNQKQMTWSLNRKIIAGFAVVIALTVVTGLVNLPVLNMIKIQVDSGTAQLMTTAIVVQLVALALAVILELVVAIWLIRRIAFPIARLTGVIQAVARG